MLPGGLTHIKVRQRMWTLDIGHVEHRSPTHCYAATRETALRQELAALQLLRDGETQVTL
jgi:hypothetical protein